MAQDTGRAIVQDPLAPQARQVQQAPQAQQTSIQRPAMPSFAGYQGNNEALASAFGGLEGLLQQHMEKSRDEAIVRGKEMYMAGVAEHEMLATGNRFTEMGYKQLQVRDEVNQWYLSKQAELAEGASATDPQSYQAQLAAEREKYLEGITDPYAKKVAVAALEQFSPALAQEQFKANNAYNYQQRLSAFESTVGSTANASLQKSTYKPEVGFNISPTPVAPVMASTDRDRDVAIRTMVAEAGGEGDQGMAAVAHVLRNRATDGRWPKSIAGVALQPNQFSAWNKSAKAGGLKIVHTLKPGSAAYERAGRIYDAVMAGKHIDPTNGATHYYAPKGMEKLVKDGHQTNLIPRWLQEEGKRSGGQIRIGNQIFVGKTSGKYSNAPIQVAAPKEEGAPQQGVMTREQMVEKYFGKGADVSDDDLAREAARDNTSGTTAEQQTQAMQHQTAEQENITPVVQQGAPNEVLDSILNYPGLKNEDKASAVARRMKNALDLGSDQLFQDVGGVAILQQLGAKPQEIDQVLAAKERYDRKKESEYSADYEKWRDGILRESQNADADMDSIQRRIDEKRNNRDIGDTEAKALTRQVLDNQRNISTTLSKAAQNPEFLKQQAMLYKNIKSGALTEDQAYERVSELAKEFGLRPDEIMQLNTQVFSLDQGRWDKLQSDAKSKNTAEKNNVTNKQDVEQALAAGHGLNRLNKEVTVPFGGTEKKMSQQDFGIQLIKEQAQNDVAALIKSGELTEGEAIARQYSETYRQLQKHDVIDKGIQAEFNAAITGNILDKDGNPSEKAVQAYDVYQILARDPQIKPSYLAKLVGDEYTRLTLQMAMDLDAGGMGSVEALVKAKELMDKQIDNPQDKFNQDKVFVSTRDAVKKSAVQELTKDDNWVMEMGGGHPVSAGPITQGWSEYIDRYLTHRADVYKLNHPNVNAKSALEAAKADFVNNHRYVMGNLVKSENFKLEDNMGLQAFGTAGPDKAVEHFITEHGAELFKGAFGKDDRSWYNFWQGDPRSNIAVMKEKMRYGQLERLPLRIDYNPNMNTFNIQLYSEDGSAVHPVTKTISARVIGDEYKKYIATPTAAQEGFKSIFSTLGQGLRSLADSQNGPSAEEIRQMYSGE